MYPTFQQFLAQWKAKFGCEPYIGQKVRIDPEAKYADEWADIAYVVYSFAPDRYRGGQVGITACLEDANDSHKSCTDWQISELIPSQENEIQHPAQTPLVLFSGISLKVHYRLGLELNWSWDEYGNWDEMVGS
ncbi:MAG: hypothetical protein RSD49_17190 [Hafnia sp.]